MLSRADVLVLFV